MNRLILPRRQLLTQRFGCSVSEMIVSWLGISCLELPLIADKPESQFINNSRKMHIQSIPMCKCCWQSCRREKEIGKKKESERRSGVELMV